MALVQTQAAKEIGWAPLGGLSLHQSPMSDYPVRDTVCPNNHNIMLTFTRHHLGEPEI
jgi:hypothetical protein